MMFDNLANEKAWVTMSISLIADFLMKPSFKMKSRNLKLFLLLDSSLGHCCPVCLPDPTSARMECPSSNTTYKSQPMDAGIISCPKLRYSISTYYLSSMKRQLETLLSALMVKSHQLRTCLQCRNMSLRPWSVAFDVLKHTRGSERAPVEKTCCPLWFKRENDLNGEVNQL